MKKLYTLSIAALLALPLNAFCAEENTPPIGATMTAIAGTMQEMFPAIFSSNALSPSSDKLLTTKVDQLITLFEQARPHVNQNTTPFKASYSIMMEHLETTDKLLKTHQDKRALEKLKILPSLCVSCHTQDSSHQKLFTGMTRNHFTSDFEYAEFSYATRDYGTAITYYDKFLTTPGTYHSEQATETALERLLTLYVQVDKEPKMAGAYLEAYLPFIVEFPKIKVEVQEWVKDLKTLPDMYVKLLSGEKTLNFEDIEFLAKQLEPRANQKITPNEEKAVPYVVLRGFIYHYLNQNPKMEETPKLLYWLALCDKKLDYQFYHSFADVYLKECFTSYPNSDYAPKCKREFDSYQGVV